MQKGRRFHACLSLYILLFCLRIGKFIELLISEIERNIYRDFYEIEHIEEETEIEEEAGGSAYCLYNLSRDAACIAYEQENLKEKALALCRARNE